MKQDQLLKGGQRGQAIVIFALAFVVLFGLAAVAIDQGFAMADRRDLQVAADGASLAGTRQYSLGGNVNAAHFVAMQYLTAQFSQSIPGSCTAASCGDGPWTVGDYTFTFVDSGSSNQTMDVSVEHARTAFIGGAVGLGGATVGTGARARPAAPVNISAAYNVAALSGAFSIDGGGTSSPSGNVTGNVYSNGPFGANNGPHAIRVATTLTGLSGSPPSLGACPGNNQTRVDYGPNGSSDHWEFYPTPEPTPAHPRPPTFRRR